MIDVKSETLIRLQEARRMPYLRGRNGKPINLATLFRWALRGIRGIRLETVKIGGATLTSEEALLRFIEQLNHSGGQKSRPAARRKRDVAEADRRLDAAGI